MLKQTNAEIRGSVSDDGIGFETAEPKSDGGVGLSSMKERTKKLGGELLIESAPASGTSISFVIPLKEKANDPAAPSAITPEDR
jgi:signal transduction histidine kinase